MAAVTIDSDFGVQKQQQQQQQSFSLFPLFSFATKW